MTAIAPSSPMSCHVGEMTLPMMSAASSNSRPSSSQVPKRRQISLRAPWPMAGRIASPISRTNASSAP